MILILPIPRKVTTIGEEVLLAQQVLLARQVQPVRPPELVRHAPDHGVPADPAAHRALAFRVHDLLPWWSVVAQRGAAHSVPMCHCPID